MAVNMDAAKRGQILNSDPADDLIPVSGSDTVDIQANGKPVRGLLVGTAGAATVITAAGNVRTLVALQAGYNPIRVTRVYSTGLTAASIWGLI